jgi:predicted nucleic acid-binding protein
MSHYFLDSSALVKRYVVEVGTTWIRSLTMPSAGNGIFIAQIAPVEIVSGTMRRWREGHISLRTAQAIRILVDRQSAREYLVIGLTTSTAQRAENLLETYPLRAYDAVQLASAIESNARLVTAGLSPLTFVSADNRLLNSASAEGLATDNPNLYP